MELTQRILGGLKGCLDTVVTTSVAGAGNRLRVNGFTDNPAEFGWVGMPDEMKVAGRHVYCCKTEGGETVWVFADETRVVDAPADMVVGALMDILWQVDPDAAERIVQGDRGEVNEEVDDDSCHHPWHEERGGIYCPLCGADDDQS